MSISKKARPPQRQEPRAPSLARRLFQSRTSDVLAVGIFLLLVMGLAVALQSSVPIRESPADLDADRIYRLTKRTGRLTMEQIQAGLNTAANPPGAAPSINKGLQGPAGKRNGVAAMMGIEFTYVHADLEFEGRLLHLHPKTQLFQFIPWDQDHSFGQMPRGTQEQRDKLSILHPWQGKNPFLERMFKLEQFKKPYLACMDEFSRTICAPDRLSRQVDEIAACIRSAVQEESAAGLDHQPNSPPIDS